MKFVLKLIAVFAALFAVLLGLAWWQKNTEPEYVEIYSDGDDDLF